MDIIGKRIKLLGNHPHSGENGKIESVKTTVFGQTGLVVKLENCSHMTDSCFVFHDNEYKLIK